MDRTVFGLRKRALGHQADSLQGRDQVPISSWSQLGPPSGSLDGRKALEIYCSALPSTPYTYSSHTSEITNHPLLSTYMSDTVFSTSYALLHLILRTTL